MRTLVAIGCAVALAGCSEAPQLGVDHAWVRLPAVPGGTAAAYFTIHGGQTDATLIAVSCDVAVTTAMHESMTAGAMTGMRPLESVTVPARSEVAFRPGGRHAMLHHLNPGVKPGRLVTLTLSFADGTRLRRKATAVGAGEPAPQ